MGHLSYVKKEFIDLQYKFHSNFFNNDIFNFIVNEKSFIDTIAFNITLLLRLPATIKCIPIWKRFIFMIYQNLTE